MRGTNLRAAAGDTGGWVNQVHEEAKKIFPSDQPLFQEDTLSVEVSCYHTLEPPDVDNILKPICDGMIGAMYEDDKQIWRVVSQRFDLSEALLEVSPLVKSVSVIWSGIVHIVILRGPRHE